jgi:hypothetical protein
MASSFGRGLHAAVAALQEGFAQKKDLIRIVSIDPSGPVTRGVEIRITVELEYTLETADKSSASIGFNSRDPNNFTMGEHIEIHRGTDRVKVKATVIPVDWGRRGKFAMLVNIGMGTQGKLWSPTASARHEFAVVPQGCESACRRIGP